jgi:N-formylglutamate amidohydrolase
MIRSFVELLDESVPVLALAIHNGHEMHPELLANCGISEADRLREEDPFTDVFTNAFANKIIVYTSRFTVDLNRNPDKAVYQTPEDCWGLPARINPISEELLAELKQSYNEWYSLLTYTVKRLLKKHPFLLILDLHSFNHRRKGADAEPDPQLENPDIILGRNNMPLSYYPFVECLRSQLDKKEIDSHTLDCRIDVKFTGGYVSRWLHHSFPNQVLCPAVEFKKIFMDEWSGLLDKGFQTKLSNVFFNSVEICRKELNSL